MNRQLAVFAKYWQPGEVKTRLAQVIGHQQAAMLHRHFLLAILGRFRHIAAERVLVYTPQFRRSEFAAVIPAQWSLEPQAVGDLGTRMQAHFATAFNHGARQVLLLGSDSPTLPLEFLAEAFRLLESNPVVLGPSYDGGYYLVGAAAARIPPIFSGPCWGSADVWAQTVARLDEAGIEFATLPQWYDIDRADDLKRLHADLSGEVICEELQVLRAAMDAM